MKEKMCYTQHLGPEINLIIKINEIIDLWVLPEMPLHVLILLRDRKTFRVLYLMI